MNPTNISEFQDLIAAIFLDRDRAREPAQTFAWLVEDVGEPRARCGRPTARTSRTSSPTSSRGAWIGYKLPTTTVDLPVTERGRSLSTGQRQLIVLARALLVDAAILILDEATANLDLATEARVQRASHGDPVGGRTTILIAHRLQTAQRADRIFVIDHGRVVEEGRHEAGTGTDLGACRVVGWRIGEIVLDCQCVC